MGGWVVAPAEGVALATGGGAFGCFTRSERAWAAMRRAGALSGDRPWRLPLWNYYSNQLTGTSHRLPTYLTSLQLMFHSYMSCQRPGDALRVSSSFVNDKSMLGQGTVLLARLE